MTDIMKVMKRPAKKKEYTINDLAAMVTANSEQISVLSLKVDSNHSILDRKISNLDKRVDIKIENLSTKIKNGFDALDSKLDFVYEEVSVKLNGMGQRLDHLTLTKADRVLVDD